MTLSPLSAEALQLEFITLFDVPTRSFDFKTLTTLYSHIYQIVIKGSQLGQPKLETENIKKWCEYHYNKYISSIFLLRELKYVRSDVSIINNIFAYPLRYATINHCDSAALEIKRKDRYNTYENYCLLFLSEVELCTDVIKYIGRILIDFLPES